MTSKYIGTITLLVNNYDEAIDFYTNKVGFKFVFNEYISFSL
jgi:catechol 2,3-dioxygenase-like lactoylglutathione lyase family enzyme